MTIETVTGAALVGWGLWTQRQRLSGLLPALAQLLPSKIDDEPTGSDDFEAFQQLQRRAARLQSPEASECLRKALVPLFGGEDGGPT